MRSIQTEISSSSRAVRFFLRVFVDTDPEGMRLARRFDLKGTPTMIILDSKGREIDRIIGGISAPDLMETLKLIFEAAEDGGVSI